MALFMFPKGGSIEIPDMVNAYIVFANNGLYIKELGLTNNGEKIRAIVVLTNRKPPIRKLHRLQKAWDKVKPILKKRAS